MRVIVEETQLGLLDMAASSAVLQVHARASIIELYTTLNSAFSTVLSIQDTIDATQASVKIVQTEVQAVLVSFSRILLVIRVYCWKFAHACPTDAR